jgi:putative ABC transport system permease protein
MAIGARGRDILLQFLIEAVTLSVIGGIRALVSGFGVSSTQRSQNQLARPVPFRWMGRRAPSWSALAVGIFFGFYPARKALNLDPIDALRYE